MNKSFDKELKMLSRKNADRCSICKMRFDDDDDLIFTCIGYDKRRKLQITADCCQHELVQLKRIGIFGEYEMEEFDEIIQSHPKHAEFMLGESGSIPANQPAQVRSFRSKSSFPEITPEDRDLAITIVNKYLSANALVVGDGNVLPEAFNEIEQAFTEKYNNPELAYLKCIMILAEIADHQ